MSDDDDDELSCCSEDGYEFPDPLVDDDDELSCCSEDGYEFPDPLVEERRGRDTLAKMTSDELRVHTVVCREEATRRREEMACEAQAQKEEKLRRQKQEQSRKEKHLRELFQRKFLCLVNLVDEQRTLDFVRKWGAMSYEEIMNGSVEQRRARFKESHALYRHDYRDLFHHSIQEFHLACIAPDVATMSSDIIDKYMLYNDVCRRKLGRKYEPVLTLPAVYPCQMLMAFVQTIARRKRDLADVGTLVSELYHAPMRSKMIAEASAYLRVLRLLCMKYQVFYPTQGTIVEMILEQLIFGCEPISLRNLFDEFDNLKHFDEIPRVQYSAAKRDMLDQAFRETSTPP